MTEPINTIEWLDALAELKEAHKQAIEELKAGNRAIIEEAAQKIARAIDYHRMSTHPDPRQREAFRQCGFL